MNVSGPKRIAALLAEGGTDWRTVRMIIARTELVSDEAVIAKLDESLAERIRMNNWENSFQTSS